MWAVLWLTFHACFSRKVFTLTAATLILISCVWLLHLFKQAQASNTAWCSVGCNCTAIVTRIQSELVVGRRFTRAGGAFCLCPIASLSVCPPLHENMVVNISVCWSFIDWRVLLWRRMLRHFFAGRTTCPVLMHLAVRVRCVEGILRKALCILHKCCWPQLFFSFFFFLRAWIAENAWCVEVERKLCLLFL